jgi:GNAT superfamily N-acetyltransferase
MSLNQEIIENEYTGVQPIFSHVEPVLAVQDILETTSYWQNVLGFPSKWTWGDPPNHGGVSWQKVFIQFSLNPKLATVSQGNSIWIRLQHLETLYNFHKQRNAEIIAPLENKPWGMAQYTLREINGYFLHFAAPITDREKSVSTFPQTIRIVGRKPSIKEYRNVASAVGWSPSANDAVIGAILSAAVFAVVAEDAVTSEIAGCALLLGDHASFYYVKDVMVHPDWQGKRVGTAMMQALTYWLEKNGANNALVGLIARETLEPFYQQFGFAPAFSMLRYIHRDEKDRE